MEPDPVILYILMRTDMESMNPGKAVAQGAHAANKCVFDLDNYRTNELEGAPGLHRHILLHAEWSNQTTSGFGTTITLGCNEAQMMAATRAAQAADLHTGVVFDPTYPLRDGQVTHLLALNTCAYILARKSMTGDILINLSLMP